MQKQGFPSMKRLNQFKSLQGSISGAANTFSYSSRPSSDSTSASSFANLKLTAEKLVKEQASMKTDLEMTNAKLKKSMDHMHVLEEKLRNAFNENAKLKVKQQEDEKLWKGLDSKFSSTNTLCDQLTETLQHLAGQVQDAEKDKKFFEEKLSASSTALDDLNQQMNDLSLKLEYAEQSIRQREKELKELKTEKEERHKFFRDEQIRTAILIEEKDAIIKKFEATIAANTLAAENLNTKLDQLQLELRLKEDEVKCLIITHKNLEKEKADLHMCNEELTKRLAMSLQQIKNLEDWVRALAAQLVELDKQSLIFSNKFDTLNSLYDSCFKLVQQEKNLAAKLAQKEYIQLHDKFLCTTSEKDSLQLVNQELNNKIGELQKVQESVVAQLSEECRLSGERIQKLESEAQTLFSEKKESELLNSKLEEKIGILSKSSRSSEDKMKNFLLKISALETESRNNEEKLKGEIQKKADEIETLQKEAEIYEHNTGSLEKQVSQLHAVLEEKEQLSLQCRDTMKKLGEQVTENQALLAAAESRLAEARKQYDLMLESKQLELSRHLKEISQRNDQAINDIQRKYELEKVEIVNMEKEKLDKVVGEIERKCEEKLAECKEELRKYQIRIQEEHAALVSHIQQEHDKKELSLRAEHSKELKYAQNQAEHELREKMILLQNDHEAKIRALTCQHEDDCKKLQEELDLQKSKEDRQRALLQLQWKVMGGKGQEQEVNSKKNYSVSSVKMADSGAGKRSQHVLGKPQNEEKDSPFLRATQTPMSQLLRKVGNLNTRSGRSIPKHHKKVTHHEYEVETSNGKTITKRRKTKSTVMFEDPKKHKKINAPKANTPGDVVKGVKKGVHSHPSNIGDLFTEDCLNPYEDDPYIFD